MIGDRVFEECVACRNKSASSVLLCASCIKNRQTIADYNALYERVGNWLTNLREALGPNVSMTSPTGESVVATAMNVIEQAKKDHDDAERWRALAKMPRVRMIGGASTVLCLEFYNIYPRSDEVEGTTRANMNAFTNFIDQFRRDHG